MTKRLWKSVFALVIVFIFLTTLIFTNIPTTATITEEKNQTSHESIGSALTESSNDTGAGSASEDKKGGAIFISAGTTFDMNGAHISGTSNVYGGAIFVSTGGTLIMQSGSITNCSATYGGGIYVQTGATCTITGGSISNCTADFGPAIYVEAGANFFCEGADINDSEIKNLNENYHIGTIPSELTVKRAGEKLASGAVVRAGEMLEITYQQKDDYYMDITATGVQFQGGSYYVVENNVELEYIEKSATLDQIQFNLNGNSYEVSKLSNCSGEVVIPNFKDGKPITAIPYGGFASCQSMTNIYLPDSITSIGSQAFVGCAMLTSIDLPNELKSLNQATFFYCMFLSNITIPSFVSEISSDSFSYCFSLQNIKVDKGNIKYTSRNNSGKETNCIIEKESKSLIFGVTIPDDGCVTRIKENAIQIQMDLETFEEKPFDIYIPECITEIEEGAFYASANDIKVSEGNTRYTSRDSNGNEKNYLVDKQTKTLIKASYNIKSEDLPTDIVRLGMFSLFGFNQEELIIPDGVTSIASFLVADGFYSGYGIKTLIIPDSVKIIEDSAFCWLGATVQKIKIGSGVEEIGEGAFQIYDTTIIQEIIVDSAYVYNNLINYISCGQLNNCLYIGGSLKILAEIDTGTNSYLNSSFTKSEETEEIDGKKYNIYIKKN